MYPHLLPGESVGVVIPDPGTNKSREGVRRAGLGNRLRTVYLWVLFSTLLLGGVTFILKSFHDVYYPFGWDDDEGAVWWEAAHVTNLHVLYHSIQEYPYFVVPYPPFYHGVTRLAAQVTGNFLVAGRLVCVFSALGISLVLGLLVLHASSRRISVRIRGCGAVLTALLCFRLDSLSHYIPEMGVDLLAVFLTFLGVFLFIRFVSRPVYTYAAFAVFVLALFTKQTMVAAPAACLAASALINPHKAFRHLVLSAMLGLAGLGYLFWVTGGEILRHLFLYNARQPFAITHWIVGMQENLILMLPIATISCLAFLPFARHWVLSKRDGFISWLSAGVRSSFYRRALFVLGVELFIALLITVTYGKQGSGNHYFLEWNFVCCPLVGLVFVRALDSWRPSLQCTLGGAALFLLLFLAALTGFPDSLRRIDSVYRFTAGERQIQDAEYSSAAEVWRVVKETPGPVLCENMLVAMKAHKEIPIEPGIQCFLGRTGIWDQSGFIKLISSQKFGVIIVRTLDNGFWTDAIVEAIRGYYIPAEQIGDERIDDCHYTVYRPRPKPGEP
jgi:hypothetical protein